MSQPIDSTDSLLRRISDIESESPISARLVREITLTSGPGGEVDQGAALTAIVAAIVALEARDRSRHCDCGTRNDNPA